MADINATLPAAAFAAMRTGVAEVVIGRLSCYRGIIRGLTMVTFTAALVRRDVGILGAVDKSRTKKILVCVYRRTVLLRLRRNVHHG